MARCRGEKRDGSPCERIVPASQDHCYSHDPAREEERRRNASKAAKSKPSGELRGVKARLEDLLRDVLAGEVETGRAAVANQILNTRLRAVELERKAKETDELEARIEELEREEGARWGA